jgi:FAD/FMN-containing dehydrogenase
MIDITALRGIAGDAARAAGPHDAHVHGIAPAAVVEPRDANTAAAVIALCAERRWRVEPSGGGTRSNRGAPPDAAYVLLSTKHLDTVADYRPEDLTITVGAGALLTTIAAALSRNNQWLPLDPPRNPHSTIGGLVASGSAGPLRARYGTPRDHVIGVHIITGDGRQLRFGGQVVKNVAGYDMVRPVVGSRGSLGLITKVSMRLRPLHAVDVTLACAVMPSEMIAMAERVSDTWPVAALELLSPALAADLGLARAGGGDTMWQMLVRIHGHQVEVDEATRRIRPLLTGEVREIAADTWDRLAAAEAGALHYARLSDRRSVLGETIRRANSLSDRDFAGSGRLALHAADGIARIWGPGEGGGASAPEHRAVRPDDRIARINRGIMNIFDPAGIMPGYRL